MKCTRCGAELPAESGKCPKCGSKPGSEQDTFIFTGLADYIRDKIKDDGQYYTVEPDFTNSIKMQFKEIPPGEFVMGSNEWPDANPVHNVIITKRFYMGIHPVTQEQWNKIIGQNPSYFKGDNRPVECVSWNDCQNFIKHLNKGDKTAQYRLPTEAEWEYCCRAGAASNYFFGDDPKELDKYAWFAENSEKAGTHAVGTKPANPWGLCDMHGNVWEWCHDIYGPYPSGKVSDPQGATTGKLRINRGGGWINDALMCSAVFRRFNPPDRQRHNLGFRLVSVIK